MDALSKVSSLTHSAASLSSMSLDLAGIVLFFSLLFMFGWYVGRGPFMGLLVSLYIGYSLYALFPFLSMLPSAPPITALLVQLALYFGLCLVAYIVLRRTVASDFMMFGILGMGINSLFATTFLIALLYHVFPTREVHTFAPVLDMLFANKAYFYYWFIAPMLALFFFAR